MAAYCMKRSLLFFIRYICRLDQWYKTVKLVKNSRYSLLLEDLAVFFGIQILINKKMFTEAEEALNNNFPSNVTISLSNMPFINCRWSNHDETLITHTLHVIYVYNTNGDIKYCLSESYKDIQISCCVPSNSENTVLVATNKSLDILNLKTGEKHCFDDTGGVLDIVIVPGGYYMFLFLFSRIYMGRKREYKGRKWRMAELECCALFYYLKREREREG